jgi:asparagine synthase (glutamine-hydrolysing)
VPLYFVSALARRHVTVVLTGEGSDELLAGYGKYLRTAWNWRAGLVYERLVPRRLRRAIAQGIVPLVPNRLGHYVRRSCLAMDCSPESMFFDAFAAVGLAHQQELLATDLRLTATRENAYGTSLAHYRRPNGHSTLLDRLLYADIKTYLVELLMKQDQMSMAASIESRVPFPIKLVEMPRCCQTDGSVGWTTKRVLREAMKGLRQTQSSTGPKWDSRALSHWMKTGWNQVARDVLSTGAPVSAASLIRQPSTDCCAATPAARPTTAIGSGAC